MCVLLVGFLRPSLNDGKILMLRLDISKLDLYENVFECQLSDQTAEALSMKGFHF